MPRRYVTDEAHDPRSRYLLYRLCDCPTCAAKGQVRAYGTRTKGDEIETYLGKPIRCPDCRGEGRIRQEVASAESPEAVGVALVTLAREGEWEECPFGLLDREPECETCEGEGRIRPAIIGGVRDLCAGCRGSGVKPTGTWLILPYPATARTLTAAAKLLRSRRS